MITEHAKSYGVDAELPSWWERLNTRVVTLVLYVTIFVEEVVIAVAEESIGVANVKTVVSCVDVRDEPEHRATVAVIRLGLMSQYAYIQSA